MLGERTDRNLLEQSLRLVDKNERYELVTRFYQELFCARPDLRDRFPADLHPHRQRIVEEVERLIKGYDHFAELEPRVLTLRKLHDRKGITAKDYVAGNVALINVLSEACGARWTSAQAAAWTRWYQRVTCTARRDDDDPYSVPVD